MLSTKIGAVAAGALLVFTLSGCASSPAADVKAEETASNDAAVVQDDQSGEAKNEGTAEQDAIDNALADAGFTKDQATDVKVEKGIEDGIEVYEVMFSVDNVEYDYVLNRETGAIIKAEQN